MAKLLAAVFFCISFNHIFAADRLVPEEYEVSGPQSVGVSMGSVANLSGITALRTNPSLMSTKKEYSLSGGYIWPTGGREFYQAGVIDSKTSSVAAGVQYASFVDDYKKDAVSAIPGRPGDAPMKRRLTVGGSYALQKNLSVGAAGQFIEGYPFDYEIKDETVRGWSFGTGATYTMSSNMRFAASAENLANRKVKEFAPTTYRLGGTYIFSDSFYGSLDFRQRERVSRFEGDSSPIFGLAGKKDEAGNPVPEPEPEKLQPERLAILSGGYRAHENLVFNAGYGQEIGSALDKPRRILAGSVALVGGKASLAYGVSRPHMERSETAQHSVQLNIEMGF